MPKNKSIYDELWRTVCCHVGKKCWCREIRTYKGEMVVPEGYLGKELVMYFIKLHNKSIRSK